MDSKLGDTEAVDPRTLSTDKEMPPSLASEVVIQADEPKLPDHAESREEIEDPQQSRGQSSKHRYDREFMQMLRRTPLANATIHLEQESLRELQIESGGDSSTEHGAGPINMAGSNLGGPPQDQTTLTKEEGWRTNGGRHKAQGHSGSPPTGGAIRSRLVDDGLMAGSPDKERVQVGQPGPRIPGPGWRRPADWRQDDQDEAWRPGARGQHGREETGGERERRGGPGNVDETWRPPPPGLARGQSRGEARGPPGLASADQWERPWGAGRGRLADGERRIGGKPRDPPVNMPSKESTGVKGQLPDGWNKPRDGDWRTGKGREGEGEGRKEAAVGRGERLGSRTDQPAWLTDAEEPEDEQTALESRRKQFEAERQKMKDEREAAKAAEAGAGVELIGDAEIEAMRQEALAEEFTAGKHAEEPKSQHASRPASALGFNVDSLFADTQSVNGTLSQRAESQDGREEAGSRFSRFFKLEHSPSAPAPQDLTSPSHAGLLPQQKAASQQLPPLFLQGSQAPLQPDPNQLQGLVASRAPSAAGSHTSEILSQQRSILSQLQAQVPAGNLAQNLQSQMQGLNKAQMDRLLMEKNLLSPRSEQNFGSIGRPGTAPGQQQAGQLQPGFNSASNSALLSLIHQNHMRPQEAAPGQQPGSMEPTFANPNPSNQQQNLMNALNLGNQQQGSQPFSSNLLEQLQRIKMAQSEQQKLQQLQQPQASGLPPQQMQGQGQPNANLLAAFSAQMPRDMGASKPLADDLFNIGPRDQLGRLTQPGLQPQNLGLGKNDRVGGMAGGLGAHNSSSLAHLLQSPQLSQARPPLQPPSASNSLFNLSQATSGHLGNLNLAGQYQQQAQAMQPSFANASSQPLGGADAHQIARYIENQRQLQIAQQIAQQQQQAQQQARYNQQRLLQLQLAQQQAQRAQATALLQQQSQQLHNQALASQGRLGTAEAVLRQQQMLQLQHLNLGASSSQGGAGNANSEALARFFNSGANLR